MDDSTILWILGAVAIVIVAGLIIGFLAYQRRQSEHLREHFGPEYDRTVDEYGSRKRAEADLLDRKEHVASLHLRDLQEPERARFADEWQRIQARFVDDPSASIREADRLVAEVMRVRGYTVDDFDTQVRDLSVNYPNLAENYRSAHSMYLRSDGGNSLSTEEMRRAVVHYRDIFAELLQKELSHTSTDRKS